MSYGIDNVDVLGKWGSYVDRILRGAKPLDLPVQAPTKYETAINLKTAKTLGTGHSAIAARHCRRGDRIGSNWMHCIRRSRPFASFAATYQFGHFRV